MCWTSTKTYMLDKYYDVCVGQVLGRMYWTSTNTYVLDKY